MGFWTTGVFLKLVNYTPCKKMLELIFSVWRSETQVRIFIFLAVDLSNMVDSGGCWRGEISALWSKGRSRTLPNDGPDTLSIQNTHNTFVFIFC